MKKIFQMLILSIFLAVLLSCEALPVNYSTGQSWLISSENTWTTLVILPVQVDRSGGWDSVEKETAALAPLYFWDRGCRVVAAEEDTFLRGADSDKRAGFQSWLENKEVACRGSAYLGIRRRSEKRRVCS